MAHKLDTLIEDAGFSDAIEFGEAMITDSVCLGICSRPDCDYTTDVEPDSDCGWCEECNAGTVVSGLVLMGVI